MTAPLPTLRHGVRGKAKDAPVDEATYREAGTAGIRILHLAQKDTNYERALCGKKRETPLEPNAEGEVCVVCAALYFRKHGWNWGEQ